MKIYKTLIFIILFNYKVNGQKVELFYDTVSIISIKRIETATGKATEARKLMFYNEKFYVADNFPFTALKVKCDTIKKSPLFYEDYLPITNEEALKRFFRKMDKKNYYRSDSYKEKSNNTSLLPEALIILNCLQQQDGNVYLINSEKGVGAFFFLNCSYTKGVHDNIFCEEKLTLNSIPVLLNIKDLPKKAK